MQEHLLTKSNDTSTCFNATIDWLYELVYAELMILPLSKYNPLEQIIIQIMEKFRDQLPSLKEVAERLGIMDPVFIEAVLHQMIKKGLLEKNDNSTTLDFSNFRLNTSFLQSDNKSPAIETHGVQFCFDKVTSEHITVPPDTLISRPENPIIKPEQLPDKRTHLGLDKARQLAEKQKEPFMAESARLIDLNVLPDRGKYLWQSMTVICFPQADGTLKCKMVQASQQQQEWLDQLDTKHSLFKKQQIKKSKKRIKMTN